MVINLRAIAARAFAQAAPLRYMLFQFGICRVLQAGTCQCQNAFTGWCSRFAGSALAPEHRVEREWCKEVCGLAHRSTLI
jgi:hypothetical protein